MKILAATGVNIIIQLYRFIYQDETTGHDIYHPLLLHTTASPFLKSKISPLRSCPLEMVQIKFKLDI